jgi:hypothetical protein
MTRAKIGLAVMVAVAMAAGLKSWVLAGLIPGSGGGTSVKAQQRPPSLLKGLLLVMPGLLVTNAFAITPYPGEGNPVIGASVITNGGDVKATFISVPGEASASFYDYLYVEPLLPGNPDFSNRGGGTGETPNFIFVNHGSTAGQVVDLGTCSPSEQCGPRRVLS